MAILRPQRDAFDIPEDVAYFNCAYNSPQLNESSRRLHAGVDSKRHPWERTAEDFFRDAETIRLLGASLFGADADGYALVPAVSYGMSAAARAVEPTLGAGDRILVVAGEFPSNYLPWQQAARAACAAMTVVPTPADGDWTRAILRAIDRRVRVVAVSGCHWTDGARIDLPVIGEACRSIGAIFAVDATQVLGAMPLSLDAIKPDFLVAAGYKWLLSPYGFGLMYVAERWRNARPLEESWLARSNAEDFTALADYSETYAPGARRFDVGEKCTATILPGAIAALEQIRAWGVANIADTLSAINAGIADMLESFGFVVPAAAQRCPHMFGARLPAADTGRLVAALRANKIYVSQRGQVLRFAPHLHVTARDTESLSAALAAALGRSA